MSDAQQQGWAPRDPTDRGPGAVTGGPGALDGRGAGRRPGRKGRRGRRRRTGWRRILPTWRMLLGAFLTCAFILMAGFISGYTLVKIPPANVAAVAQSNVYLYEDGSQLARDGEVNRENVPLSQIPSHVRRAVLAAEDRDFYNEPAIDPQGMARAAWNTMTGKGTQGGSTITQQYVKNYYLAQEQTVVRKGKEFFIAIKLNREESKAQILEGYLNTSYFGRNAYGIQAAAHAYYGKDIQDVDTAEGAFLAALLNAPSAYDVAVHPENRAHAEGRWKYVLDGMVTEKWLSAADRAALTFPMPDEAKPSTGLSGQRGYIVQAVEDYLTKNKIIDDSTLASGGYRITTTLQRPKQNALVESVDEQVMSKVDDKRAADRNVRVGGVSIDPATGGVVAMYGGVDYTRQYVNNATRRDYQVGSTFKPFVFTAAVENDSHTQDGERITPNTVYDGTNKRMVEGPDGPTGYDPANEDDVSYGDVTVSEATDKSINSVYAQMAQDVGPTRVRSTAVALGVPDDTPDLTTSPSIALGPATASVLDMTEAYATLANHGAHGTYTMVTKITKDGRTVELPLQKPGQAVSRQAADTTTAILRSVVEDGTGMAAQSANRPAAGKTGTAEDDKAAWFAGYTPDLATVVAIMGADPRTAQQRPLYGALGLDRVNGGGPPAQIWGQFTATALEGTEPTDFELTLEDGVEDISPPDDESGPPEEPSSPGQSESPGESGQPDAPGGPSGQDGGTAQGLSEGADPGGNQGRSQGGTPGGGGTNGGGTDGGQGDGGTRGQDQGQSNGLTDGLIGGGGGADNGGGAADGGTGDGSPRGVRPRQ
ncbi:transglycosylase domain-containing protein [Streptomyces sp. IB2014 016-6]|uniref:transglycosylase domain-containing protein n=1 Tax=Streptomyces sp. IB2014 016-6 TaxID=2517818 RepID=UPI0011C98917|nr:transglycosylase domain-containing protein [Streptomyces sp. IB2014 016-6]TXL88812.1 penicillin-binding protein [Streptomyces sp. IB2014 016-6]